MNFHSLDYFLVLAREKNFTRAAEALHVTQPAISKMIRALETELGRPLLIRSGRTIALTDAGRVVFEHGADVKIMDRLFWHREVPHSENFSKPGFQLKTA